MKREEEEALSSALDNPVVCEAVAQLIIMSDTGSQQGYEDGLAGKPSRSHPPSVPDFFKYTYAHGYKLGVEERARIDEERESHRVTKEIIEYEQRRGCCRTEGSPDHVVEPKQVNRVELPKEVTQQEEGFFKKYSLAIFGIVGAGVGFGLLGLYVGKVQERRRCMDIKRDMGVSDR